MFVFVSALPLQKGNTSSCFSSSISKRPAFLPSPNRFRVLPSFTITCDLGNEPPIVHQARKANSTNIQNLPNWTHSLRSGVVIETWSGAQLHFGLIRSVYEKGVIVDLATGTAGLVSTNLALKRSFDEIVSIWPQSITSSHKHAWPHLVSDVERGLSLLRSSSPRTLDLTSLHARLSRTAKGRSAPPLSSIEIAKLIFPAACNWTELNSDVSREIRAAATVAAAILTASDSIRFKRAGPGAGWRVLPQSVTEARQRSSFVDKCIAIMDDKNNSSTDNSHIWTQEQLELLREIQIVAASGTGASGTAASALRALGYEEDDYGATQLLLDIQYWARGKPASDTLKRFSRDDLADRDVSTPDLKDADDLSRNQPKTRSGGRDWAFPQEILEEAREVRKTARTRRLGLTAENESKPRRNLQTATGQQPTNVYCIDEKKSRFLDDALSVTTIDETGLLRVSVHIVDVDEVVTSGSAIDTLARDRGESLYLPLKPLHMLPAAVMEAASFDTSMPTEAITVSIDVDLESETVRNWEVYPSVVPPVIRVNYDQFDTTLQTNANSSNASTISRDLGLIAKAAPILSAALDERKATRRRRRRTDLLQSETSPPTRDAREANGIASVRLVKKNSSSSRGVKVAEVVGFRSTGSHAVVDDLLTSAGALLRKFAKENNAHLPEGQDASTYVARCGTAPLRRYLDLAIQRQIKCILFGRQPAGRRRMHELRTWLARRHSAGERTVAEKRRTALFDSFSNHCSHQRNASGLNYAVVKGRVLNGSVSKRGKLRFEVNLEGTGLSMSAGVSSKLLREIQSVGFVGKIAEEKSTGSSSNELTDARRVTLERAKAIVPYQSRVRLAVHDVDPSAQKIQALITDVL